MAIEYDMSKCPKDEHSIQIRTIDGFNLGLACMHCGVNKIDNEGIKKLKQRIEMLNRHLFKVYVSDECLEAHRGCVYLNIIPFTDREFENEVIKKIRNSFRTWRNRNVLQS